MKRGGNRARALAGLLAAALMGSACSVSGASPGVLNWYVTDADLGAQVLAGSCDVGDVEIKVHELPKDTDRAHSEIVRRLQADGASIDLLSVDGALIPELGEAGFLRPVPGVNRAAVSEGVVPAALAQVTVDDKLYAVPWLFDPQLLWFRSVTAERAGIDTSKPVTWEQLIQGADRLGVTLQVDDGNGTGLGEWVAALMAASGGTVVDGVTSNATVGLDSEAGRAAASTIEFYRESEVGPGPVDDAVEAFSGTGGGFLIAPGSAWSDPAIAALGNEVDAVAYPRVGDTAVPPANGRALAISDASEKVAEARTLIECLTSTETMTALVSATGHGPARMSILADESVASNLIVADAMLASMKSAKTVPVTPYWNSIRRAIDDTWAPLASVTTDGTPAESQRAVEAALAGEMP